MTISVWWGRGEDDAVEIGAFHPVVYALSEVEDMLLEANDDRHWVLSHYELLCKAWWGVDEPDPELLMEIAHQAQEVLEGYGHRMSKDALMVVRKLAEIVHYLKPRTVARVRNAWMTRAERPLERRVKGTNRRLGISARDNRKWHSRRLLGRDVQQVTGAIVRGVCLSPVEGRVPDALFYVSPFAKRSVDRGAILARHAAGLAGEPNDRLVTLIAERRLAAQRESDMALLATIARAVPSAPRVFHDDDMDLWGPAEPRARWGRRVAALYRKQSRIEGWDFADVVTPGLLGVFNFSDWQAHYFRHRVSYTRKPDPAFRAVDQDFWRRQGTRSIGTVVVPRSALAATGAMVTEFEVREDLLLFRREIHHYGDIPLRGKARRVVRLRSSAATTGRQRRSQR